MKDKIKTTKRKEVVLHYDEVIEILKHSVAKNAGEFLGLTWEQRNHENIIFIDEAQLIIPSDGLHFTYVESPVDTN